MGWAGGPPFLLVDESFFHGEGLGMELEERISALVTPSLAAMGYDLVRVLLLGTRRRTLQLMAERSDGRPMSVDDCADVSRAVSALLDVEDPIPGAYNLEVSSPGLDRPLVQPRDYERFTGYEIDLEARRLLDGRRRFRGRLRGLDADGQVHLDTAGGDVSIPIAEVGRAKLALTPERMAAALKSHEHKDH